VRWLAGLPGLVGELAREWRLDVGEPYALSLNWVAAARREDGQPVVLKLGVPGSGHIRREAAALSCFDGRGAVRLLASDQGRGALLLDRVFPGRPVRTRVSAHDPGATDVIATVMRKLHRPAPAETGLPPIDDYLTDFDDHLGRYPGDAPIPRRMVERARDLMAGLCADDVTRVVLHGDLHHDNVLSDGDDGVAIDPHGVIGDPAAEPGPALYNPLDGDDDLVPLLGARIERFSEEAPRDRVVAWGFALAVLSEVWDQDSGERPTGKALRVAMALDPHIQGAEISSSM
jgi:streptomycin 6-kinase